MEYPFIHNTFTFMMQIKTFTKLFCFLTCRMLDHVLAYLTGVRTHTSFQTSLLGSPSFRPHAAPALALYEAQSPRCCFSCPLILALPWSRPPTLSLLSVLFWDEFNIPDELPQCDYNRPAPRQMWMFGLKEWLGRTPLGSVLSSCGCCHSSFLATNSGSSGKWAGKLSQLGSERCASQTRGRRRGEDGAEGVSASVCISEGPSECGQTPPANFASALSCHRGQRGRWETWDTRAITHSGWEGDVHSLQVESCNSNCIPFHFTFCFLISSSTL